MPDPEDPPEEPEVPEPTRFPMSMVDVLATSIATYMTEEQGYQIHKRPLAPMDSSGSIAIFPESWAADPNSKLIGSPTREPVFAVYRISIQNLLISGDTTAGRAAFSVDSKSIRAILYRDAALHVSLNGLEEVFMQSAERVKKFDVAKQEFMAARLPNGFNYICKTDLQIETETTPL